MVQGRFFHGVNRRIHAIPLNEIIWACLQLEISVVIDGAKGCAGLCTCSQFFVVFASEGAKRIDSVCAPHCVLGINQVCEVYVSKPSSFRSRRWDRVNCGRESSLSVIIPNNYIIWVGGSLVAIVDCLARERFVVAFFARILYLSVSQHDVAICECRTIVHCRLYPKVTLSNPVCNCDDSIRATLPVFLRPCRPCTFEVCWWSKDERCWWWSA